MVQVVIEMKFGDANALRGSLAMLSFRRGTTFIEVIVALTVFAVIAVMSVSLFSNSSTWVSTAEARSIAVTEAQAILDVIYVGDFDSKEAIEFALQAAKDDAEGSGGRKQLGLGSVAFSVTLFPDTANELPDEYHDYYEISVSVVLKKTSANVTALLPVRKAVDPEDGG